MVRKARVVIIVCCLLVITGVACLIAGLVLLNKPKPVCAEDEASKGTKPTTCEYSSEAVRIGFPEFLQKVQKTYYDLHPYLIPKISLKEYREKFMPYDPSPANLKLVTDKSLELLRELQSKKIVKHKLKSRERKALAQMLHFLQHSFGTPFGGDYYAGDYLLGPDMFCWQAMCSQYRRNVGLASMYVRPYTIEEVEVLLSKIKAINHTFTQYKSNLMYGVKAGMVRSTHPCKVGADALIKALRGGFVKDSPQGILSSSFGGIASDEYLSNLTAAARKQWLDKTGKTIKESLRDHVIEYIGKPLYDLVTYLRTTYLQHCAPSQVVSGLAKLPIAHVYVNGTRTNQSTYPYLPDGTPLNGSKAYEHMLSFFTTTSITPNEVQALGYQMIDKLYSQILGLARQYTNQTNNDTAKEMFKKILNSSDMYYDIHIPDIESNATAYARCTNDENAQKYCPVRWKIIQMVFENVNKIMSMLDGETVDMFYFNGPKHTTPNCPISPRANYDSNMGVPSYAPAVGCRRSASYKIPFFLSRPGPKFNQWSVNSHEARPGHHTQVQGHYEHFLDSCGGVIGWLGIRTRYTAFVEGWGLYAENPLIAKDTTVYVNRPTDKYGMFRGQLWRALRLVVDTGLHFTGLSRQQALDYFKDYAWVDDDVVKKEITRYQSNPGQATSYMVGQLHLIKLRARAQKELGENFNLKDFHYHILKHGSAPLSYLTESIDDYIRCTKNTKGEGCEDILSVEGSGSSQSSRYHDDMDIDLELLPKHVVESYY